MNRFLQLAAIALMALTISTSVMADDMATTDAAVAVETETTVVVTPCVETNDAGEEVEVDCPATTDEEATHDAAEEVTH